MRALKNRYRAVEKLEEVLALAERTPTVIKELEHQKAVLEDEIAKANKKRQDTEAEIDAYLAQRRKDFESTVKGLGDQEAKAHAEFDKLKKGIEDRQKQLLELLAKAEDKYQGRIVALEEAEKKAQEKLEKTRAELVTLREKLA
jgi:chromosome segregation ATPase